MEEEEESDWEQQQADVLSLPNVVFVEQIRSLSAPKPGCSITLNDMTFIVTKSQTVDGIILAVHARRSHCAIVIQGPVDIAIVVIAKSPTTLSTLLNPVLSILRLPTFIPY